MAPKENKKADLLQQKSPAEFFSGEGAQDGDVTVSPE